MQIQRLLIILFYLNVHGLVKIDELCNLLEISKRTAYRDLEVLRTAGVEIESFVGAKGGICLSKDYNIEQLLLDKKEWRTIIFNSLCMSQFNQTKFSAESRNIYNKLSSIFNTSSDLEVASHILIDMNYKNRENEQLLKLQCFESAIENNLLLNISYESPFCEHLSTQGLVAPYGLINKVGFWYLAGYCYVHKIYRAYNLTFIKKYAVTELDIVRDPGFNLKEFWEKSSPK